MNILVTGATGYIGGRLVPDLLEQGHQVRVLVRDIDRIRGRDWVDSVDVHVGDLLDPTTLSGLCDNIDAAYYLVHSMTSGADYMARDDRASRNFAEVAKEVSHVIYLGGIAPKKRISKHLKSRASVGKILRDALPTTEFQAGPIIGSGSASFEMVRYLTERIPVMITPRWIKNKVSPIAVRDILAYLLTALEAGPQGIVQVGAKSLTFRQMMLQFAEARGLKRYIYPTPFLAPGLASRWVGLVTPLSNRIAKPLVLSVVAPCVSNTKKARTLFPNIKPINYRSAVERALRKIESGDVETRWSGALGEKETYRFVEEEGMVKEERSIVVKMNAEDLAQGFMTIGGERGWLTWNWAWNLRGMMDIVIGGPGIRRGRRHPTILLPGEALDFWRVESVEYPKLLRLRAEMKVPGKAWLQWETVQEGDQTRLIQTATFAPKGLIGAAYWYSLYPVHKFIFSDLIRAVYRNAKQIKSNENRLRIEAK